MTVLPRQDQFQQFAETEINAFLPILEVTVIIVSTKKIVNGF